MGCKDLSHNPDGQKEMGMFKEALKDGSFLVVPINTKSEFPREPFSKNEKRKDKLQRSRATIEALNRQLSIFESLAAMEKLVRSLSSDLHDQAGQCCSSLPQASGQRAITVIRAPILSLPFFSTFIVTPPITENHVRHFYGRNAKKEFFPVLDQKFKRPT